MKHNNQSIWVFFEGIITYNTPTVEVGRMKWVLFLIIMTSNRMYRKDRRPNVRRRRRIWYLGSLYFFQRFDSAIEISNALSHTWIGKSVNDFIDLFPRSLFGPISKKEVISTLAIALGNFAYAALVVEHPALLIRDFIYGAVGIILLKNNVKGGKVLIVDHDSLVHQL